MRKGCALGRYATAGDPTPAFAAASRPPARPSLPPSLLWPTKQSHLLNTHTLTQVLGLGTDTDDASPCALLFFDRRRLLFNAGEGFQRFAVEHGVRLARVGDVLLTRTDAAAAGGLPGLCLTLADPSGGSVRADGGAPVRVWGPPGLATLATAVRSFVDTRVSVIEPREFGGGGGV